MTMPDDRPARILVIKLGALGDIVQALGPMQAIRDHHRNADITVLTTAPYAAFLEATGLFNAVWVDDRPKWYAVGKWMRLSKKLQDGLFDRVYDLQTSDRSSGYLRLFRWGAKPEWSGIAKGCSHPDSNPDRDNLHTIERQKGQLADAGITNVPPPDLSWAEGDLAHLDLPEKMVLLVPGGAPHRPGKRWPAHHYAVLANTLINKGLMPVLLGTRAEADTVDEIMEGAPKAINLVGETSILDLASLARLAEAAVGNDSGPMHLIAAANTPSVVVYSHDSDPALCAQRGNAVKIIRRSSLDDLPPAEVVAALDVLIGGET